MSRIQGFKNFTNEHHNIKKIDELNEKALLDKARTWTNMLRAWIKQKVKLIPDGPRKGLPIINYFSQGTGNETILAQVRAVYGKHATDLDKTQMANESKDLEHLKSPWASDVPDVSSTEIIQMLTDDYHVLTETNWQKPLFIFGAPGIGKTEILAQVCDKLVIQFMPIELRYCAPVDLIGVPKVIEVGSTKPGDVGEGVTRSNPPTFWPRSNWPGGIIPEGKTEEDGPGGIVFFDEFNRADPYLIDALLQFVQTRALSGTNYKLPSKWMVVAAGNRPKDDRPEKIKELGTALIDRFDLVNYVPTPTDFIEHVAKYEKPIMYGKPLREIVLPEIITFIKHLPEWFHGAYVEDENSMGNFTPRGWVDASKKIAGILKQREKESGKREISADEVKSIFVRNVGGRAAAAFMDFYRLVKNTPMENINKVFSDPTKADIPAKSGNNYVPNVMWAWMAAIISYVDKRGTPLTADEWGNCIKYWNRIQSAEYSSAFIAMMNNTFPYLRKSKDFYLKIKEWETHYGKQIIDMPK